MTAWPKLGRVKINDITSEIIRAGMVVHSNLGPGLLENVYRTCLTHILRLRQLRQGIQRIVNGLEEP